jgi:hypothetical protein
LYHNWENEKKTGGSSEGNEREWKERRKGNEKGRKEIGRKKTSTFYCMYLLYVYGVRQ